MARLPKFLNVSLLRRMRLELPAAKVVLIAFSVTLAVVGVGAFVATLPALTAVVAPVAPESEDAAVTDGAIADQVTAEAATTDAAATDGVAAASGAAGAGAGIAAIPHPKRNNSTSNSANTDSAGSSGSSSSTGSGDDSDEDSGSGGDSGSNELVPEPLPNDPLQKVPTEAEEESTHSFLCGWYNTLDACEADAKAGSEDSSWQGYLAMRNYTCSNYSRWNNAKSNLTAAFRCLGSYAETGEESYYSEYQSYKAAVNL